MLARDNAAASASALSNDGSSKLIRLLRKRLRQLALAAAVLVFVLAVAAGGVAVWWLTSLNGLPDIGDPFDVSAFRAIRIPDEQLEIMQLLDDPNGYLQHGQGLDLLYRFGDMQLPPDAAARVYAVRRFLIREPERSRRVLRLVFANWLAQSEIPPERWPKPAVKVLVPVLNEKVGVPLYPVGPEAADGARVRSPRQIGEWLVATHDGRRVLGSPLRAPVRLEERRTYRDLVILLASELYRRERGGEAATDEALVGTYLKRLPADPSDELGDGTIPTISD